MGMVTGDWEIDLAHSIVKIADELTRIADALVCLCLVVVLFTSCRRDKSTTALLAEIGRLQMVVQEVVTPTGASDTPTVKDDMPTDAHDMPTNAEEL